MGRSFVCQWFRPLSCTLFLLCPLRRRRTQFWGTILAVFCALLVANPLPPTPVRNLWRIVRVELFSGRKKEYKHELFALVNVQMALEQTAGCPRVNRVKKFMCSPRNTGNINFSLWLTGGLSQGCPDFQKVYGFKVYVPCSCPNFVGKSGQKDPPEKSPVRSSANSLQQKSPIHFCGLTGTTNTCPKSGKRGSSQYLSPEITSKNPACPTIPTEMFTRQIRQNLKSATAKITNAPKILLIFKSVIPTGDLALFSRHTGTLVGKFAGITDPKFRGIWSRQW